MSNIYIQEPPTHGKVLLETTVGDIDIELWSREAPKACRNFVQLCMEGYYNGTKFHRVIKGFIAQGGDPTGTGTGGESIYGHPFKDEFHTRLRFVRRGLVAMANAAKDDNGSQFFFTLDAAPELQGKHTIFGKVTGHTLYNMLRLEEGLVDHDDRPLYPHRVIATQVLNNPFPDIVPRKGKASNKKDDQQSKLGSKSKGTKNFKLLSFGDEAEEDEEETNVVAKEYRGKSKSSHDLAHDPGLSSVPAVEIPNEQKKRKASVSEDDSGARSSEDIDAKKTKRIEDVQKKLKKTDGQDQSGKKPVQEPDIDKAEMKKKEIEDIRKEVKKLKKELTSSKSEESETAKETKDDDVEPEPQNEALAEYHESRKKYVEKKKLEKKEMATSGKKSGHEDKTLALLEKFKSNLQSARLSKDSEDEPIPAAPEEGDDNDDDAGWLSHTLSFEHEARLAKDANIKDADSFEIYDPRNPINQRRREASKAAMKEKKRKR